MELKLSSGGEVGENRERAPALGRLGVPRELRLLNLPGPREGALCATKECLLASGRPHAADTTHSSPGWVWPLGKEHWPQAARHFAGMLILKTRQEKTK